VEAKLGVIFDEEDSAKINELIHAYETDVYNLLASAIDTIYKCWQKDINSYG
jgi:hypothetical protein